MQTIENIRNSLIDKLLSIQDKDFLLAIDKLISSSDQSSQAIELSSEQIEMLEMSEADIRNGSVVSQEELDNKDRQWLSDK